MKLHCFGHSGHSYKIASYLNLAGIEWEPVFVDFFNGEARAEPYLSLNPMGEVPYFEDGETKLSQSGVILDYLVEKSGFFASQYPRENLRWILWDTHKGSSVFGMTRFFHNFMPEAKRNPEHNNFLKARTKTSISFLEKHFSTRDFVHDNQFTTADLCLSSYLFYPEDFGWSRDETPAIDAWLSRIENMPNWKHPYDLMPVDQEMINRTPAAKAWHKKV